MTISRVSVFCLALAAVASPAAAQGPWVTAAAGVTSLREQPPGGGMAETYDPGWAIAVGAGGWKRLSGVFDISLNRRTNIVGETLELKAWLAGPGYDLRSARYYRVWGQVLFGRETFTEPGFADRGFAIQPGGGVDVYAWAGLGVRAQLDYRLTDYDGARFRDWRLFAGGVVAVGR